MEITIFILSIIKPEHFPGIGQMPGQWAEGSMADNSTLRKRRGGDYLIISLFTITVAYWIFFFLYHIVLSIEYLGCDF